MKHFFLYFFKILIILLVVSTMLDLIYTKIYSEYANTNRFQYIRSQKNNTFDYIFIGSSRVINTINPLIIDSKLNSKSINFGITDARPKDILVIIKLLKEYNISFKKLFIQTDYYYNNTDQSNFLYVEMLPYLSDNEVVLEYYINETDFLFLKIIPFYKYSKNGYKLGLRNLIASIVKRNSSLPQSKGFEPLYGHEKQFWTRQMPSIVTTENKYNKETLQYLKINNLDYQFFIAPFRSDTKLNSFNDLIKKKYDNLWDFSVAIKEDNCFKNGYHLNSKGAIIFSNLLAEKIKIKE